MRVEETARAAGGGLGLGVGQCGGERDLGVGIGGVAAVVLRAGFDDGPGAVANDHAVAAGDGDGVVADEVVAGVGGAAAAAAAVARRAVVGGGEGVRFDGRAALRGAEAQAGALGGFAAAGVVEAEREAGLAGGDGKGDGVAGEVDRAGAAANLVLRGVGAA